jgi:biopolymer transport protein ExbD
MMKLGSKKVEPEIPTSSMADIAFLLIIFFMVTAVFSATKGLDFKLPKDEQQDAVGEEAVFIKVFASGDVQVDCKPMEIKDILDYLKPKLSRNPEKPVILYTDPYASYQSMVSVYDTLGAAGKKNDEGPVNQFADYPKVKNISVPTQSEVESYIALFGSNPFESTCP